jgi:hypothetical protein
MKNTIEFVHLGCEMENSGRNTLKKNEFSIYITPNKRSEDRKSRKEFHYGLTFNQYLTKEVIINFKYIKLAINSITSEVYFYFTNENDHDTVKITFTGIKRSNAAINRKNAVLAIMNVLEIKSNEYSRTVLELSENLSKVNDCATFKIIKR